MPVLLYAGPKGTSHERATSLIRTLKAPNILPTVSERAILSTVANTPDAYGVVAVENSVQGELMSIMDHLIFLAEGVYCCEEVVLVERLQPYGLDTFDGNLTTLLSHPDILSLCHQFRTERGLIELAVTSTDEACRDVASTGNPSRVAVAPPRVGEQYGLVALDFPVCEIEEIRTRYLLLGREVASRTGSDKTSIVVTPSVDRAGSLAELLNFFVQEQVNMVSIVSRPLKIVGLHCFHIVFEGHVTDTSSRRVLEGLAGTGASIKMLGSYQSWKGPEVTTPFAEFPRGSVGPGRDGNHMNTILNPPQRTES